MFNRAPGYEEFCLDLYEANPADGYIYNNDP